MMEEEQSSRGDEGEVGPCFPETEHLHNTIDAWAIRTTAISIF